LMKKKGFLASLILVIALKAGDFRPPVLDPFGLLPSTAISLFSQETGVYYNPALSLFNPPVIQYSQGNISMDSGSVFSTLKSIGSPDGITYSDLEKIKSGIPSFAMETRNFFLSGKGGAMGYIYYRSMVAYGEKGENFSEENPADYNIKYLIRDRREIFFNKGYVLKRGRMFMGITTKYVFYKDFEINLPIGDENNFRKSEISLLSMGEEPVEEGKTLLFDVGISAFLTPKLLVSVSFIDIPLSKDKNFSPEYMMGGVSYSLTQTLLISAGADLRNYKGDYYFSFIKTFSNLIGVGAGFRKWENKKYYTIVADLRYHHLGGKVGINLDEEGRHGIFFSIALSDAF